MVATCGTTRRHSGKIDESTRIVANAAQRRWKISIVAATEQATAADTGDRKFRPPSMCRAPTDEHLLADAILKVSQDLRAVCVFLGGFLNRTQNNPQPVATVWVRTHTCPFYSSDGQSQRSRHTAVPPLYSSLIRVDDKINECWPSDSEIRILPLIKVITKLYATILSV